MDESARGAVLVEKTVEVDRRLLGQLTRAADLLLNGARLDAAEAVRMDIANETATDALATATERARALADRSAHAVEQTVRLLRSVRPPTNVSMAVEPLAVAAAVGTAEFREATARFR